ncbi:gamma-glutamylcyclotransferase [Alphaproteobacteria bacterium GH1-50]|uniref:glutathione-specific gamma-glutamylcyclotransferase n=1 Tax=Kangsaoukella pontilimi TaxID=2691042 RepID=A0A7C9IDS1_9RHOB|nr:gamma-glutamylcyclotransferase [Kangsaoukella pontilimi]MXQ06228.1 gamma-glutamylcyclotransferase [Kangsaoukella pontilimi]
MTDPFRHHPELRGQITPAEDSWFRNFTLEWLLGVYQENGRDPGEFYDNEAREALRREMLRNAPPGDLWVFGYGSLMWDPAFHFSEVRRARIEGYERRFILVEDMARGSEDRPGVMAALDEGQGCNGLIFRIPEHLIERETEILCRRELVGPAYIPLFHPAETDLGTETTLILVADHTAEVIQQDLTREKQVEYLATGEGLIGTSADYLRNIVQKSRQLGIDDPETEALLRDVEARIAQNKMDSSNEARLPN